MSDVLKRSSLATGIALAVMQMQPAKAVSLGELRVQSGLGQPFVATTTARLGPGETIASTCITTPGNGSDGLTSPSDLKVLAQNGATPGNYPVQIRTSQPLYEPMYEIRLQIDCPGGVALSKNYVVMLNLPMAAPLDLTNNQPKPVVTPNSRRSAASTARANTVQRNRSNTDNRADNNRLSPSRGSITAGQPYRVRNGDTLSTIAERVEGRPVGSTWRVAEMLFANNPKAFIRGDRDMLKLGALINIPAVEVLAGEEAAQPAPAIVAAEQSAATGGELLNVELGRPEEELLREIREANAVQTETTAAEQATQEISQIDTGIGANVGDLPSIEDTAPSPFADEAAAPVPALQPETESAPRTANTNVVDVAKQPTGMSPIMAVLAGIGMGILLALLMLGRNIFGPLLEGRARRKAALAANASAATADRRPAPTDIEDVEKQPLPVAAKPAATTYGGGGIDVEIGEAPHQDDVDVDLLAAPEDGNVDPVMATGNAPRVSLRPESDPADESHFDTMDNSATMRTLFEDAAQGPTVAMPAPDSDDETVEIADDSESATAELPAVDASHADIDITDLESLSRRLQDTQDDKLSATLTQALGLLEQDYEEEMTASQILDQREVDEAFSQHKSKD